MRKAVVRGRGIDPRNKSELADMAKPLDIGVVENRPLPWTYEDPFMNRIAYFNMRLHGAFIQHLPEYPVLLVHGGMIRYILPAGFNAQWRRCWIYTGTGQSTSQEKKKPVRGDGLRYAKVFFLFFDPRFCLSARKIVFIHIRKDVARKGGICVLKEPILFLFHMAVIRMALRYCPKLDLPKALPEVFALDKTDAICERNCVLRKVRIALGDFEKNRFCVLKRSGKFRKEPRFDNFGWRVKTVVTGEKLMLLGEHAVAMEISPRADIHLDFKEGICVFKCA